MHSIHLMTSEFTSDFPPEISASLHQSNFAPYVSGSYSAQWNAPELPHDKHMSHLSCILGEIKVEESFWAYGYYSIIEHIWE